MFATAPGKKKIKKHVYREEEPIPRVYPSRGHHWQDAPEHNIHRGAEGESRDLLCEITRMKKVAFWGETYLNGSGGVGKFIL